jgi:hypothetical protein
VTSTEAAGAHENDGEKAEEQEGLCQDSSAFPEFFLRGNEEFESEKGSSKGFDGERCDRKI